MQARAGGVDAAPRRARGQGGAAGARGVTHHARPAAASVLCVAARAARRGPAPGHEAQGVCECSRARRAAACMQACPAVRAGLHRWPHAALCSSCCSASPPPSPARRRAGARAAAPQLCRLAAACSGAAVEGRPGGAGARAGGAGGQDPRLREAPNPGAVRWRCIWPCDVCVGACVQLCMLLDACMRMCAHSSRPAARGCTQVLRRRLLLKLLAAWQQTAAASVQKRHAIARARRTWTRCQLRKAWLTW